MKKNILFIHHTPLIARLREAFNIDDFIRVGYGVKYFDVSSLYRNNSVFSDEEKKDYVVKVSHLEQLASLLPNYNNRESIVILPFRINQQHNVLISLLKGFKFKIVGLNIYPHDAVQLNSVKSVIQALSSYSFLSMAVKNIKPIASKLLNPYNGKKHFNYYFSCSGFRTHAINNPNYDIFLRVQKSQENPLDYKYILFVDSYFPLHPECINFSRNSLVHAQNYHKRMRHFFDWLEEKYKIPVVIAAHPSSVYNKEEFGKRKIIKYKTAELTKNAEIIIQHSSFSHMFAVLFDKPIVFIITKEMKFYQEMFASYKIKNLAHIFSKKAYNISKINYNKIVFSKIDGSVRERYIYNQVTSKETENLTNKEIMLTEIENIFNTINLS